MGRRKTEAGPGPLASLPNPRSPPDAWTVVQQPAIGSPTLFNWQKTFNYMVRGLHCRPTATARW